MTKTNTRRFGVGTVLALTVGLVSAQNHPSHQITNGEIAATVYLPDAKNGFYTTTYGHAVRPVADAVAGQSASNTLVYSKMLEGGPSSRPSPTST